MDLREFDSFPLQNEEQATEAVIFVRDKLRGSTIWHTTGELCAFYELAAGVHGSVDGYCIQLGLFHGGSACVMGHALRQHGIITYSPVLAIDPYSHKLVSHHDEAHHERSYTKARRNIQSLNLQDFVCPVIFEDVGFINKFWEKPIRVCHIDTTHAYKQTWLEIEAVLPYCVPDAWLLFHDYSTNYPGNVKAVNEFIDKTDYRALFKVDNLLCLQLNLIQE